MKPSSKILISFVFILTCSSCLFLGKREKPIAIGDAVEIIEEKHAEQDADEPDTTDPIAASFDLSAVNAMLLPGIFHGEDVPFDPNDRKWLALYHQGNASALRPVRLKVKPAFDPILDGDGDSTALEFSVNKADSVLVALFSGWSGEHKEQEVLTYPLDYPLALDYNSVFNIDAICQLAVTEKGSGGLSLDFIPVDNEGSTTHIHDVDEMEDAVMQVLWSGDVNGDGKPDLLLNIAHKYSYTHLAFYLSNTDHPCSVIKVAEFRFTAC